MNAAEIDRTEHRKSAGFSGAVPVAAARLEGGAFGLFARTCRQSLRHLRMATRARTLTCVRPALASGWTSPARQVLCHPTGASEARNSLMETKRGPQSRVARGGIYRPGRPGAWSTD